MHRTCDHRNMVREFADRDAVSIRQVRRSNCSVPHRSASSPGRAVIAACRSALGPWCSELTAQQIVSHCFPPLLTAAPSHCARTSFARWISVRTVMASPLSGERSTPILARQAFAISMKSAIMQLAQPVADGRILDEQRRAHVTAAHPRRASPAAPQLRGWWRGRETQGSQPHPPFGGDSASSITPRRRENPSPDW